MRREPVSFLLDVELAAAAIERFLAGSDREAFLASDLLRSAVERKFEIIGEALSQLSEVDPQLASQIAGIREVIGFRNILAHGYASIDPEIVWHAAVDSLRELRAAIAPMLASAPRSQ